MAYNLQSLITILQGILDPQQTRWILEPDEKPQLQSLLEKVSFLQQLILEKASFLQQQILEKTPLTKIPSLEIRIRDVANEAEDIVESHMVKRMLPILRRRYMQKMFVESQLTPDVLLPVTQKLDSVAQQVAELVEVERNKKPTAGSSSSGASFSSSKSVVVVGVDDALFQLKDRLTGMQSKLEILPIVGMGGIGKTTLARTLYDDPSIVHHFSYLARTTISQDYNMRSILLSLIQCIIGKQECDKHKEKGDSELKDILYQSLYGRKYMIVLDDIWSTKFWDEIRRYFPDNNNGSRIVITTRESDVAKYADSKIQHHHHKVQLLSESQSWDLLSQIVFGEDDCPHELQWIGKQILSDCCGLPLAINVIGGLLSKVERSEHVWENIGKDVRAAIGESDKQFSNILSLSYNHLPLHLKPCFLYMAAFPEDYEIKASRLIQMWVAEGFVKSNGDKSLEEEAEDYLKSLVERNVVSVRSYNLYGKAKRYSMHDLLRDLCIRKADDEKFLHVKNSTFSNQLRRVSIHRTYGMESHYIEYASSSEMSLVRSFLLFGYDWIVSPMVFTLRLLRVLDLLEMNKYEFKFPKEILQLVNLRYLAICCKSLPRSGISRLCNLQTLIADLHDVYCPADLWEMSELRHLIMLRGYLCLKDDYMKKSVLKKLQTIRGMDVTPSMIRRGFLESIPNIKSLKIRYWVEGSSGMSEVVDLTHLHKLQTLRWCSTRLEYLLVPKLPSSLRKLHLKFCVITPAVTTALCALSNLEVLKIDGCTFKSNETEEEEANEEWEIAEGDEFSSLQSLQLDSSHLVRWRADETNFPRLRHLIIRYCPNLEEISAGIGEIPTLQLIHLERCSDSAMASAKQIQEEQQSEYENYDLQLRIFP